MLQALPFWIASLITGVVAVLYAKLFAYAEMLSEHLTRGHTWVLFLLTPACFILAWLLVKKASKYAVGSGIPQVMAAIELATPRNNKLADKLLNLRLIAIKILSTLLMVTGGGIVGREGPTVQIAGSIFRKINQLVPDSWPKVSKKNMIITGAAAGLAAAFNTPLGGIVFAVEELAKTHISYFKTAIFTGVIIAGLTAQGILGPYLYLGFPDVKHTAPHLILLVAIVASIAGFMGSITSVIIIRVLKWKRTMHNTGPQLLYVTCSALLIAAMAYFINSNVTGSGKGDMTRLLFSADKHVSLGFPLLKIIGAVASFTAGGAGGVFAPALGIGATIGGVIAELLHYTSANANILILCGMVAFLTGITRSPFTSAILVLEMTDGQSAVFYLMIAGMIASLVALIPDKHSMYDHLKDSYLHDIYKEKNKQAYSARQQI